MIQTAHILFCFFIFLTPGCLKSASNDWKENSATKNAMFLPHPLMSGSTSLLSEDRKGNEAFPILF